MTGPVEETTLRRSGLSITRLGFGTASIGGLYRAVGDADAEEVLTSAWDAGIRYFDTAPYYGNGLAEQRLGAFLRGRAGVAVSTKVGRVLSPVDPAAVPNTGYVGGLPYSVGFDYSYDGIMRSYGASLARLGRGPDILYVHDIGPRRHGAENARYYAQLMGGGMKALAELKGAGVRAVGLGVNDVQACLDVLRDGDIDVLLLANRYTLLDHGDAAELMRKCAARTVDVVAGGVFNSGILAAADPATGRYDYKLADAATVERVRQLSELCRRHGTDVITAALAFPFTASAVRAVLIGTASRAELEQNISRSRETVPPDLWQELDVAPAVTGA